MLIPDFDFQVLRLSESFYANYSHVQYDEISTKENRRYNCLLVQTNYDYYICIPFRSNVNHRYAFHFKNSNRSKQSKSALDFTKTVIIKDPLYLDPEDAVIDTDEFNEVKNNIGYIVYNVLNYVNDYVNYYKNDKKQISSKEFSRRYKYTALKYFHKELGIE